MQKCTFFNNTPFNEQNPVSFGGAIYAEISELIISDTSFIENMNFAGGAIYIEQHKKYTIFIGCLKGIIAKGNTALDDAGFIYLSNGLLSFNLLLESSYFYKQNASVRKIFEKDNFIF